MKINLTKDEVNAIIQMMDIATKQGGLNVASVALPLVMKFQMAMQEEEVDKPSES